MFFVQVTSLHLAAQFSSASVVEALLTAGADVKAVDSEQCSPLYLAVKHNEDADVIKVLVAGGADVKAVDPNEQTFLHIASKESKSPRLSVCTPVRFHPIKTNGLFISPERNSCVTALCHDPAIIFHPNIIYVVFLCKSNKDGLFGKSDPFYIISKRREGLTDWMPCFTSGSSGGLLANFGLLDRESLV